MNDHATTDFERLFLSYLAAEDQDSAETMLGELVTSFVERCAMQYLANRFQGSGTIHSSGRNQEMLDITGEVRLSMVGALRRFRSDPASCQIESLKAYTIAVTRNAYYSYLRRNRPNRFRLSNQLRYIIERSPDLTMEKLDDIGWVCRTNALAHQLHPRSQSVSSLNGSRSEIIQVITRQIPDASTRELTELVKAVLSEIQRPARFDEFVSLIAEIRGVGDRAPVELNEELRGQVEISQFREADRRDMLAAVWQEVIELPLRHRMALLLHLADTPDENLLMLFTLSGVASMRAIAKSLEIDPEEFAEMWNDLPLPDNEIARRMGLQRQQVINLRQSARFSLRRRLKDRGLF